ncbi:MAG: dehydrogenase [Rhodopirellula sp. TMED11]|nr:MAG: dehydrogenase [Rhodopirellula sp. TMED11]
MKQILQHLGNGETLLVEVPCPVRGQGAVRIQSTRSLVSLGTEKMLIDFGKGGWLAKARSQPEKVKQVLAKIKTDGLWSTVDAVKAKLDTPIPLGYCNVGRVVDADVHSRFAQGARVVSNGPHAEMVCVPENLCARIPDSVSDEAAAYTVVGAIGLQGIRLLNPTLGERVVVSGLGLIGLLCVQMLRANGCEVLGIDYDAKKLELARSFGAKTVDLSAGQDPVQAAEAFSAGVGVDGVLITASTKSDQLMHQAATMCRKRGRIVLVGVVGLNLSRADFYEKELSFQVSCSYGPGRYDSNYEQRGLDYPIGFVRWTEQRNFEAVLSLIEQGKLQTEPLTTHRFEFDQALDCYAAIEQSNAMGILLNYPEQALAELMRQSFPVASRLPINVSERVGVAFVGAGAFTTRMLLPNLPAGIARKAIISGSGVSAAQAAQKFNFETSGSDFQAVLDDPTIDLVCITTPHHTHAAMVCQALQAGKHVFVEKPLAINEDQLQSVRDALSQYSNQRLMLGFNRRFSPHTQQVVKWLAATPGSKSVVVTVNAGAIPAEHWTQQMEVGGGRIIGEACHFIDLARFLIGCEIQSVDAIPMTGHAGSLGDTASIQLGFADGSIATIHYFANGSAQYPKERVEVFAAGKVMRIDNFRKSKLMGGKGSHSTRRQDKGHRAELAALIEALGVPDAASPIPVSEILEVSAVTLQADQQIRRALASFPASSQADS